MNKNFATQNFARTILEKIKENSWSSLDCNSSWHEIALVAYVPIMGHTSHENYSLQ